MDHDYAQRRRVALAIAVTAIAGPAAFLLNRGGDEAPTATAPPGTVLSTGVALEAAAPSTVDPADTDPLGTAPVGYLAGSTLPEDDEPARIAIPRLAEAVKGVASFSSDISETTRCQAKTSNGVPFNATLTVTNLDNSRSVQCVASVGGPEPTSSDVVLATATFAQIADLTDAPVPVQITWAQA